MNNYQNLILVIAHRSKKELKTYSRLNGRSFPKHCKKFSVLFADINKKFTIVLNMIPIQMVPLKELTIKLKLLNELLMAFVISLISELESSLHYQIPTLQ